MVALASCVDYLGPEVEPSLSVTVPDDTVLETDVLVGLDAVVLVDTSVSPGAALVAVTVVPDGDTDELFVLTGDVLETLVLPSLAGDV